MYNPASYVLLIDDDEDDLQFLSSGLGLKGIRVKSFNSAEEALYHLQLVSVNQDLPSLIIMDYNMPRKNGYQLLLVIKSNQLTKDIPVVINSTGMNEALNRQLRMAGAFECFSKPWSGQEIKDQVKLFQDISLLFIH